MKVVIVLAIAAAFLMIGIPTASAGDPAIICKSDSTGACKGRKYCCHKGMDSSAGDKYCKKLGCKRGGTSSCPTAANVSSCGTRDKAVDQLKSFSYFQ
jgi:hypothetical protein